MEKQRARSRPADVEMLCLNSLFSTVHSRDTNVKREPAKKIKTIQNGVNISRGRRRLGPCKHRPSYSVSNRAELRHIFKFQMKDVIL